MRNFSVNKKAGRAKNNRADDHRLCRRRANIAKYNFNRGYGRGQQLENSTREFRKVDGERGVRNTFGHDRQHDEAWNNKRALTNPVDLRNTRADRGAEDDEIKRR